MLERIGRLKLSWVGLVAKNLIELDLPLDVSIDRREWWAIIRNRVWCCDEQDKILHRLENLSGAITRIGH